MRALNRMALVAASLSLLAEACSDSGPTAIELPIATIVITNQNVCKGVIVGTRCRYLVEAKTAEGQLIIDPILRWTSNDSSIARLVGEDDGIVEARSAGSAMITVSNSAGTASASAEVLVLFTIPK